jgi:hypothetical protein
MLWLIGVAIIGGVIVTNMYHYLIPEDSTISGPIAVKFRTKVITFVRNIAIGLPPGASLIVVKSLVRQ